MTCIVGLTDGPRTWIGADSAGVDGHYNITEMASDKVFANGDFIFGFTTSFRMGQLLRYRFKPPHLEDGRDIMAYLVCEFIDAVRATMKEAGYSAAVNSQEYAGTFLLGHKGRLFRIEDYYSVIESANGYDACGCGEALARGALFATPSLSPKKRLTRALEAAAHHSAGVMAPFKVMST